MAKKIEEETKECTFKPKTNTKRDFGRNSGTRAESADTVKKMRTSKF